MRGKIPDAEEILTKFVRYMQEKTYIDCKALATLLNGSVRVSSLAIFDPI